MNKSDSVEMYRGMDVVFTFSAVKLLRDNKEIRFSFLICSSTCAVMSVNSLLVKMEEEEAKLELCVCSQSCIIMALQNVKPKERVKI